MKVVKIGRAHDNDIVISDSSVSRYHLEIIKTNDGIFIIKDLDSRNGTYVNGRKIKESELKDTDIIRIGNTTLPWLNYFKFSSDYNGLSDTEDIDDTKNKKTKTRNMNFRKVLNIIMTILSLMLMMFALLRYLK